MLASEQLNHPKGVCGVSGRDALRKQHSALFLAKARAEATLQAESQPPAFTGSTRNGKFLGGGIVAAFFQRKVDILLKSAQHSFALNTATHAPTRDQWIIAAFFDSFRGNNAL